MGKTKKLDFSEGGGVVSEFTVEGYSPGDFLPAECGDIVSVRLKLLTGPNQEQTLDVAMDTETALGLSKSLALVSFTMSKRN